MNACDKTLATPPLRDNGLVGTPDIMADGWQARVDVRGRQGILAERNRNHRSALVWGVKSRRRGSEALGPDAAGPGARRHSDVSELRTDSK
jgi:hypothetical protein